MKMTRHSLALALLTTSGTLLAADPAMDPDIAEAKGIVKQFATRLQGELQSAMQQGGPIKAISVCKERAPAIASSLAHSSGWEVGRTSLKVRNTTQNTPDDWERAVLTTFEERKAAGESVKTMAYSEIVDTEQGQRFRFMKAIPTQEVCLACHGSNLSPEVTAALDKNYPEDQARGYAPGDVRGAFTLSKPLINLALSNLHLE
ncbi:hypothetical protein ThidrDRAFT_3655 [Thiorhodococcus drewsii AZ1]|uniref:Tll0287-like domain-containing protein n=1 Tax=Thiorhodococcus drewsii AZ1 TaxID=765913 RepID=G2E5U2_9GAMM|nr:DUF3365 domain-containing protein [Thiorhodococcus drewsii]EGV28587.1 hypothetical protein ThidrDRAFT_3655 [Thiorhodococcus drewsii AZ1]